MTNGVILALDQGTTSSRAMAIGLDGQVIASAQEEFPQIFPQIFPQLFPQIFP